MTDTASLGSDEILRALMTSTNVRVIFVVTTGAAREAARRHGAVGAAAVAMGRALTAGLLLATLTKDDERVTLQILGDGPLGAITVDAAASGRVRAYVRNPAATGPALPDLRLTVRRLIGNHGFVSVIRDLGLPRPFSGRVALADGEIDTDVERYLEESEQIPSALACETLLGADLDVAVSAGILVQALPGDAGAAFVPQIKAALRSGALLSALRAKAPLAGPPPDAASLARSVLASSIGDFQILDRRPVAFHCGCSRERASGTLALLGPRDLADLAAAAEPVSITCEFCRARYDFSPAELAASAVISAAPPAPP